ncbi:MAG: enoyl-CoA hydratase/isomerase family protein, partial [Pseudomonadota bacterium]
MPNLPATKTVELEWDNGWLTIWFNQPEKRNALTDEMRDDMLSVLGAVEDQRSVRGITLRGRGGVFCAGGDLKHFQSEFQTQATQDDIRAMSREAAAIMHRIFRAPQVTIAVVEGAAVAGGFGVMCCA